MKLLAILLAALALPAAEPDWASLEKHALELLQRYLRIESVNPPADTRAAAALFETELKRAGLDPRIHVSGPGGQTNLTVRLPGRDRTKKPLLLLNHFDVVPVGLGWTRDPFGGEIADGKLYGRGSCDMKAGIASAVFAVEAIRRAGITTAAPIEISGTVDEESGGFAGVAWLAENGWLSRERTKAVIIPEPFGVDRVCIGHRGVYWFEVTAQGRIAHGSMPYLGVNAVEGMSHFLDLVRDELGPALSGRITAMPVVPEGSKRATININGIDGGQAIDETPSRSTYWPSAATRQPPNASIASR